MLVPIGAPPSLMISAEVYHMEDGERKAHDGILTPRGPDFAWVAAMITLVRFGTWNLAMIWRTCVLIVFSARCKAQAISLLERPWISKRNTSVSRSVNGSGPSGSCSSRSRQE